MRLKLYVAYTILTAMPVSEVRPMGSKLPEIVFKFNTFLFLLHRLMPNGRFQISIKLVIGIWLLGYYDLFNR